MSENLTRLLLSASRFQYSLVSDLWNPLPYATAQGSMGQQMQNIIKQINIQSALVVCLIPGRICAKLHFMVQSPHMQG